MAVSAAFADLDDDWPILRAALAARALEPIPFTWDPTQGAASPATRGGDLDGDRPRSDRAPARRAGGRGDPPPGVEAVLVTYVWGYVSNREAFLAWAERTAPTAQLINPLPVLRWNTDKTYLADLDRAGIPTVPTTFLAPSQEGGGPRRPTTWSSRPWAAADGWRPATSMPMHPPHVSALHGGGRTAMPQPYQRSVDAGGETAMLFFHHEFSQAVNKGPLMQPDGGMVDAMWKREVITPVEPPGAHLALARQALAEAVRLVGPTTYARVDGVDRDDGSPAVLELEPVEPSLFLTTSAGAADRFAAAVSASLGHPPPS